MCVLVIRLNAIVAVRNKRFTWCALITIQGRLAKKHSSKDNVLINLCHKQYLLRLLSVVLPINTKGINPQELRREERAIASKDLIHTLSNFFLIAVN